MLKLQIRKIVIQIEETCLEMGREVSPPSRKVTVAAVITNPYAGQYVEDLSPLYALGAEIGGLLAQRGVAALGVAPFAERRSRRTAKVKAGIQARRIIGNISPDLARSSARGHCGEVLVIKWLAVLRANTIHKAVGKLTAAYLRIYLRVKRRLK